MKFFKTLIKNLTKGEITYLIVASIVLVLAVARLNHIDNIINEKNEAILVTLNNMENIVDTWIVWCENNRDRCPEE